MKFYSAYIVLCSDNSYYTGMTNDLERRINQHKTDHRKDSYTLSRRPIELKWYLQWTNPSESITNEKQIKGWTHRKKETLITENWKDLVEFSKNYTDYENQNKG